jgi:hypothetical protein
MAFEIKECTLEDIKPHPTLLGRTVGKVKVKLRETRANETFDHDLVLKVWASTRAGMTEAQIKTALLARAAHILRKTVAIADVNLDSIAAE